MCRDFTERLHKAFVLLRPDDRQRWSLQTIRPLVNVFSGDELIPEGIAVHAKSTFRVRGLVLRHVRAVEVEQLVIREGHLHPIVRPSGVTPTRRELRALSQRPRLEGLASVSGEVPQLCRQLLTPATRATVRALVLTVPLRMFVTPRGPKNSSRFGEASQ
jgi:hypothetical protein